MEDKRVILALNGELTGTPQEYHFIFKKENIYIGADGGTHLLTELGLSPNIIIGDFDSLTEKEIQKFHQEGVDIYKYPVEKDETDGELAIDYCHDNGLKSIIIIGSTGGRIDQQLANIFLLEYAQRKGLNAIIKEPGLEMGLIEKNKMFVDKQGYTLSLLPLSKRVSGVYIKGCKFLLEGETLFRYKTRGISNYILKGTAEIRIKSGRLLYILKGADYK